MGASLNNGGGGSTVSGSFKTRRTYTPMAEINVTPFVDVMLVLLIVFMVAAPLMTVGVPVDLPDSKAQAISESVEPLTVSVDSKGEIYLQETKVTMEQLVPRLTAIVRANPKARIYVRGDKHVDYGRVMKVMGRINGAGFTKVALVTDQELN
ncbi:MAG: protein TolR [Alphaproteobacteria bacterium]